LLFVHISQAAAAQSDLRLVAKSTSPAASSSAPSTSLSSSTSSTFLYPELVAQLAAAHHRAATLLSDAHRLQLENHALTRQAMDTASQCNTMRAELALVNAQWNAARNRVAEASVAEARVGRAAAERDAAQVCQCQSGERKVQ
jgi:hypothetical protein